MCASHRPSGESDAPLSPSCAAVCTTGSRSSGLSGCHRTMSVCSPVNELHREHTASVIAPGQRVKMTQRRGRLGLLLAPIRRNHPQALRRRPFHHETASVSRPDRRRVPCTGGEPDWERAAQVIHPQSPATMSATPAAVGRQSRVCGAITSSVMRALSSRPSRETHTGLPVQAVAGDMT